MKRIILLLFFALVFIAIILYSFISRQQQPKLNLPPVEKTTATIPMRQLSISSPAFGEKGKIPPKYTCDGEDISPPLTFSDIPDDTQSLALIVEDPDAPGKTWVHWVVFNISPHITEVHEDSIPLDGIETVTDFGQKGYGGPCPPTGTHRYYFKLYALDAALDITEDVTREEIEHAMEGHILEEAELIGLYSRE
jgi:Raf kinase inhibitor-like YbhB/YbcL family protein